MLFVDRGNSNPYRQSIYIEKIGYRLLLLLLILLLALIATLAVALALGFLLRCRRFVGIIRILAATFHLPFYNQFYFLHEHR